MDLIRRPDGRMQLPYAVTLGPGSSRADLTGSWRTDRPVYQKLTAPCGHACPAGSRRRLSRRRSCRPAAA